MGVIAYFHFDLPQLFDMFFGENVSPELTPRSLLVKQTLNKEPRVPNISLHINEQQSKSSVCILMSNNQNHQPAY